MGSNEDRGKSRRPGREDPGCSSTGRVLDGRTIERSGDTVCSLHHPQGGEEHGFLGLASKPRLTVFWFGPQNRQLRFGDLGHKITVMISWFGPQNQAGYGLSVEPQN
jgi:hypothetical protein